MHTQLNSLMQAETSSMEIGGQRVTAGILVNWPCPAALITDANGILFIALDSKVVRQVQTQAYSSR